MTANTSLPVDLVTMRATTACVLGSGDGPDALPPALDDLDTLTAMLRGHLQLLAPEVEQAARRHKEGSISRYRVLGCVWEARARLESRPSGRNGGVAAYTRRLARVLKALCDHYEQLGGGRQ